MTSMPPRLVATLSLPILLFLPVTVAVAQATPPAANAPGAMPQDRTMTCEMIAGERATIDAAVATRTQKKEKAAKVRKGLFGFAKGMASAMLPGAASLGGNSMLGSLAAQGAGQGAARLIDGTGSTGEMQATPGAKLTETEQVRLDRLAAIAAYRRCAA